MRTAAFAIALLLSGTALAQTSTTTQPDVDVDAATGTTTTTPDADATATTPTTTDADATATTSTTTDADATATTTGTSDGTGTGTGTMTMAGNMPAASGQVVQPSNAAPKRDARGIAVISDPAVVPAGFNGTTGTGMGGPLVDPATGNTVTGADAAHPPCTATVTDNCVQTYERRRRR
jgi:hypothetical protein